MGVIEACILGAIIVIIVVQLVNRALGAGLAALWCAVMLGFGVYQLNLGAQVSFFGVGVNKEIFITGLVIMLLYNSWACWRALKTRR